MIQKCAATKITLEDTIIQPFLLYITNYLVILLFATRTAPYIYPQCYSTYQKSEPSIITFYSSQS